MSSLSPQTGTTRQTNTPGGQRPSVVLPVAFVGLLIVGAAVAYKMFQHPPPSAPAPVISAAAQLPVIRQIVPREEAASAPAVSSAVQAKPASAPVAAAAVAPNGPAADPQQLMVALASLDIKGPISAADAQKWKDSLQQLVRQGPASVGAIRDYLAQNLDVNYAGVEGADQLGYASLRAGLLSALGQIGGPEATTALLQTMQTTVFPSDVAAIAATLEQQSPGQYSADVLSAVRSQLAAAAQNQLGDANVGPLFQLLASAAAKGTDISADLSQYSANWPYYAAIEMANLPNGAGVASLVQMAQSDTGPAQIAAAQSLAQLATQNSTALTALVNMIQQGQLSDTALAQLAPYLGGRENELGPASNPSGTPTQGLHIASGNQDFTAADLGDSLTPAQVTQRISAIDQLLQSIPSSDPQGQQALQQQKINLTASQGK